MEINMHLMDICEMQQDGRFDDTTENSLLSLDDRVLSTIMNYLCIKDLSNLAETCVRLECATKEHFEKHRSEVELRSYGNTIEPNECRRVFSHFGEYVKTVKLSFWCDLKFFTMIRILSRLCLNLDTLILESVGMNHPLTSCNTLISEMFGRLRRFEIRGCFWSGWCPLEIFFGYNSTLEKLSIINCGANSEYMHHLNLAGFRELKELELSDCQNLLTEDELQACLENNYISSLVFSKMGNLNLFRRDLIDPLCYTIDSLTIDCHSQIDLDEVTRLTHLKTLRIRSHVVCNLDELLSRLSLSCTELERLEMTKIFISKSTVDSLKKLKILTHLKIDSSLNTVPRTFFTSLPIHLPQLQSLIYTNGSISDDDIIFMFKLMPNLKRLNLLGCNPLSYQTYMKMVEILNNDWKRQKLEFTPPTFEESKALNKLENIKNVLYVGMK